MGKMSVVPIKVPEGTEGPAFNRARVRVNGEGGTIAEGSCDGPRGSYLDPLTDAEVIEKFRTLAASRLAPSAIDAAVERSLALERERECGWLFEALDRALV